MQAENTQILLGHMRQNFTEVGNFVEFLFGGFLEEFLVLLLGVGGQDHVLGLRECRLDLKSVIQEGVCSKGLLSLEITKFKEFTLSFFRKI